VVRVPGYRSRGPGLERGPLSLVSTTEELLGRKSSGSGLENQDYDWRDPSRLPRDTLYPQKLAGTSPTNGGRSVGILCSRTQATEFSPYNSVSHLSFFKVSWGWDENESTWYIGHYLVYCISPGWWMMVSVEQSVGWLEGETEALGINLSQCHFIHHKSHKTWPGLEPGSPRWEVSD
jgi:hypothetical protein